MTHRIGFVGTGVMGTPMARNLLAAGHAVAAFDVDAARVEALCEHGATGCASPGEAAAGAAFVFTMLPRGEHVREVLFADGGVVATMASGSLLVEMSTIAPADTDAIGAQLAEAGIAMIDAPVGRTSRHAEQGKLLLMVGGAEEHVARARPLLEHLGDTIVHCGPLGAGSRMKVVNNYQSIALDVLTAETLTLAEASGLDLDVVLGVLRGTAAGQGHLSSTYPAQVLAGNVEPGFPIEHAEKDLGLAVELAASVNAPTALGAAARQALLAARAEGRGRQDWTAVYETVRGLAGLAPRGAGTS